MDWIQILFLGSIYLMLESIIPIHKEQGSIFSRKSSGWDMLWLVFNDFFQRFFDRGVRLVFMYVIWTTLANIDLKISHSIPPLWALLICFMWDDLSTYIYHRMAHSYQPLWSLHRLHHSPKTLDWVSGTRNFWAENIIYDVVTGFCFVFIELPPQLLFLLMFYADHTNYLLHSNARINLGPFRYFLVSGETHRWHHSKNKLYKHGCNFGGRTLMWDWIFGTVYIPKKRFSTPKEYGISENFKDGPFERLVAPLVPRKFRPKKYKQEIIGR